MKIHQPTTQQALVNDYLESNATDTRENNSIPLEETIDRPDNVRSNVDPARDVFRSDRRYHTCICGIPGCPEARDLTRTSIAAVARMGLPPCEKCNPVDYRIEQETTQNASLGDF